MNISRRTLLPLGAGVAAAGLGWPAAARPVQAPGLKLGLASYSLRKLPLEGVLDVCARAGIRHLSLKDTHLPMTLAVDDLKAAAAKIASAGVTVLGAGVMYMKVKDEAAIRAQFTYAKTCGFPLIVAAPAPETLDLVEGLAKEFDLPVAIHNHGPEDAVYPTPKEALALVRRRDRRMGVCMDVGHTVRAGADPAEVARACGERLFDLHVKDLADKTAKPAQVPVGRGAIDVVGLFKTLVRMKFSGHVALEYEIDAEDPVPGVRESFGYMRGVATAIGAAT